MIVPVTKSNEQEWAALCADLWPDESIDDGFIQKRANGELPYEFLYYVEDEAVAFLSLSLRHDYVEGTDSSPVGYLEGIYVKPNFRKNGIARELVEFAKDWAKQQGCTELASDCVLDNETSRLFHNHVGFKEANRIVCFAMDLE
jgi:aminoglycoside 6'-N-acetyltransferase I